MNIAARTLLGPPRLPLPRCSRCTFTSCPYDRREAADLLLGYAARWRRVLAGPGTTRRCGGAPAWSVLEHGCHVRDMCLLFRQRIDTMLGMASPIAPSSGASEPPPRYRDEDALRVAEELGRAAEALADRLEALTADEWEYADPRLPDPRPTVDLLTRHLLHDICHSLSEVLRGGREHGSTTGAAHRRNEKKAAGGRG